MKKALFLSVLLISIVSTTFALTPIPKEVSYDESVNGGEILLYVGQTLSLSLSENPTTGYHWTIEEYQPSILEQLESVFKRGGPAIGSGGTKIFGFLAKRAGETYLKMDYQRPWDENVAPANTFSVMIKVVKAGPLPNFADSMGKVGVMNLEVTLADLARTLSRLKSQHLDETSVIEIRPGPNKEYLGFVLITDSHIMPKCPNQKLPMTNRALKNVVNNLLTHYGSKAARRELGFTTGGVCQPGYIGVTLSGTALELFFNIETGEPMGKLTGEL